jgi:hypothetical protein
MRVFLDECVDWRLSRDLIGHQVMTARQMGWASIKNGELLALAAQEFDVFVTVDRNLSFQQNLTTLTIAVIVLQAPTNRVLTRTPCGTNSSAQRSVSKINAALAAPY